MVQTKGPSQDFRAVGGWDSVVVLEQYVRRMSSDDALGGNIKWQ
jgi:putative aminopeptidase FrvX